MITLIHGPAELLRSERLAEIRARISPDLSLADLNTSRLDGRQMTMGDLQFACDSLPFLAERRLVIVEGLLSRAPTQGRARPAAAPEAGEAGEQQGGPPARVPRDQLLKYLDQVPESTELVLLESELLSGGPVLRRLMEMQRAGGARIVACPKPHGGELMAWIQERAGGLGVRLEDQAARDLAEFVGDDLRLLEQELAKLHSYVGAERPVTRADVRQLVPATRAANVFDLVEALGAGEVSSASRMLHHALEYDGEQPLVVLALIARQYRLLIQAKALQKEGSRPPEIARAINVPVWKLDRLLGQARRSSFARLQGAIEQIAATDEAIKTGRLTDREALDVLFTQLATPAGVASQS